MAEKTVQQCEGELATADPRWATIDYVQKISALIDAKLREHEAKQTKNEAARARVKEMEKYAEEF